MISSFEIGNSKPDASNVTENTPQQATSKESKVNPVLDGLKNIFGLITGK
jgi:hypothetical protein